MRTTTLLYTSVISFCVGVVYASFARVHISVPLYISCIAVALFLYYVRSKTFFSLLTALTLIFFVFGLARLGYADKSLAEAQKTFNRQQDTFTGVVVSEVAGKDTAQQFVVEIKNTRVIVTTGRFPTISYGDVVTLSGDVKEPEVFETDTGKTFDYPHFLAARGVVYQMLYPDIVIGQSHGGNSVKRFLFSVKDTFLTHIRSIIPEPHAALLGGLVVGTQEAMGEGLLDAFRTTGLIHIVVLSGYNITIVAESIMRFFGFLPKRVGIVIGAVGIMLFAILTGATPTIVRASIMALLVLAARMTGRTYEISRALLVTAFLMMLYNPYVLVFDPSFQLSFLATLGLICFVPLLEPVTRWMSRFPTIQSLVLATVATQLFVLPLLLYQVGTLSIIALVVNILVLPIVPAVMFFGLLTGAAGYLHPYVGLPFGFISYALLGYILTVVVWFSKIPFAAIHVEAFPLWAGVGIYMFYGCLLVYLSRRTKYKNSPVV